MDVTTPQIKDLLMYLERKDMKAYADALYEFILKAAHLQSENEWLKEVLSEYQND